MEATSAGFVTLMLLKVIIENDVLLGEGVIGDTDLQQRIKTYQ